MKSQLEFYHVETDQLSDCGDVLDIEFSAGQLHWEGVVLEKGSSPYFYPKNIYTPYFYFALALEKNLNWNAKTTDGFTELKTSPGDVWINPPRTPFFHDISEPCYFVILAIEEAVFFQHCPLSFNPDELEFLNNYNVHDESVKGIVELFLLEARGGGKNGYAYLKNLLSLLSTHYIKHYSNFSDIQDKRKNLSKFDLHQVEKVQQHIESNIGNNINVDGLADLLGCSKFYFLREFKKLMGITPYQFILNKRLETAKLRLSSAKGNIASLAQDLGFNDQSHFSRAFKNQYGVTPRQFQNQSKTSVNEQ